MIDAHNHLQQFDDPEPIINEMRSAGISQCVVNGTSQQDWQKVASLTDKHPDFVIPAFGVHPWHAHEVHGDWLQDLTDLLKQYPSSSIGECGLDRWVKNPPLDVQLPVFVGQISLARKLERPLIIHCLKAWGPLLEALENQPPLPRGFMLHSYGGSAEMVQQLTSLGAYFSFSGYFLNPRKAKTIDAYRAVPDDRLLIETDAPSMTPPNDLITHPLPNHQNHPANLLSIAQALADQLEESANTLISRCTDNTYRFFHNATRFDSKAL